MAVFNTVLFWINNVIITIVGLAFTSQFVYTLLFFLKPKKFKVSKKKHKFAVFILARNEESVIGDLVKSLKAQNYPKELLDIYVVVNNTTDRTAEVAKRAGGDQTTVLVFNDPNPKHHRTSYGMKRFFEYIKDKKLKYDAFVRFDADNIVDKNYISLMNDAYSSGAKLARGYNHARNLTQNVISGISGLWYIRDCRFSCQARSRIGCTQIMVGSGMMISDEVMRKKNYEWTELGICEDADFSVSQLFEGVKVEYVSEAITYEDQPSTIKDTFNRNVRMGHGLFQSFFKYGFKALGKFFTTFKYKYLDMFFNFLFVPIAVVMCVWLPLYYGYDIIYNLCVQNYEYVAMVGKTIALALVFAFIVPFILQAFLVYFLDKKKINQPLKKLLPAMLMFPAFMIIYAIGITWGVLTKPKWKQIRRNTAKTSAKPKKRVKRKVVAKLKKRQIFKISFKNKKLKNVWNYKATA